VIDLDTFLRDEKQDVKLRVFLTYFTLSLN